MPFLAPPTILYRYFLVLFSGAFLTISAGKKDKPAKMTGSTYQASSKLILINEQVKENKWQEK